MARKPKTQPTPYPGPRQPLPSVPRVAQSCPCCGSERLNTYATRLAGCVVVRYIVCRRCGLNFRSQGKREA